MAKQPQTVTEKYDIVGIEPGKHFVAGFGWVDLINIDITEADHLYRAKFPFLQKKTKSLQIGPSE